MGDEIDIKLAIKWSGNEYEIEIGPNETVADLKASIYSKTRVKPERQKLMGLKGQKGNIYLYIYISCICFNLCFKQV